MLQGIDVGPSQIVRPVAEVIVAERLDPSKHGVDLGLIGDEGGQRIVVRLGDLLRGPEAHLRRSIDQLDEHMNARGGRESKSKRRSEPDTYCLTERRIYGWPQPVIGSSPASSGRARRRYAGPRRRVVSGARQTA